MVHLANHMDAALFSPYISYFQLGVKMHTAADTFLYMYIFLKNDKNGKPYVWEENSKYQRREMQSRQRGIVLEILPLHIRKRGHYGQENR